jgi:hypothetical protein
VIRVVFITFFVKTVLELGNRARHPMGDILEGSHRPDLLEGTAQPTPVAQRHETKVVKHFGLHLLAPCDTARCPEQQRQETLHLTHELLDIYVYFAAISSCLLFPCRLKINHKMELQKRACILVLGMVTNIWDSSACHW